MGGTPDITRLLGTAGGAAEVLPLVYEQLRRQAQGMMARERRGHTLSATVLVHEAYLKLVGAREIPWEGRGHFYAAAAEAMRRVLLDHAKARGRVKRGRGAARVDLDAGATLGAEEQDGEESGDFVALDEAMCRLAQRDPRMGQVIRLRFYAGLSVEQTALALGVSEGTVKHDWAFARAWLARAMAQGDSR